MDPILPPVDPTALPAPVWLFRLLLVVTFFLHVVAMNFLLGGGFFTAISGARGRANVPHHRHLADRISKMMPIVMAATITLGVAPLLFIQVLYGRFFYTSSILMAVPWISVVFLLVIAYYGHYYMAMSDTLRRERRLWIAWVSALLVAAIGFIYTNNLTLMMAPERFRDLYLADRTGFRLNTGEPTLIPRYLHMLVGALAVSGLGVVFLGQRGLAGKDPAFGRWAVRYGRNWFAGATLVQVLIGVWFLFTLPPATRHAFLGGNPVYTAHLFGAAFLALIAAFLIVAKPDSRRVLMASTGLLTLTLVGMILVRMWVRDIQIGGLADLGHAAVATQWSVLPLFLVLFLAALVTLAWMIRAYVVERGEG
jgi:hypothetical protein